MIISDFIELLQNALLEINDLVQKQQAKIERLESENLILSQKRANIFEISDTFERGKAAVTAERDKAIEDLTGVLKDTDNTSICDFCEFYQPCMGKDCEFYEEGIGVTIDGIGYNFKWNCLDFDVCRKRENTPCEGCDFKKNFKWRGLGSEGKTAEQALKERTTV